MLRVLLVALASGAAPLPPASPPERPAPRDCAAIEADARALVEEARACSGRCVVMSFHALVGDACTAAFQCSVALPAELDLDAFAREARALDDETRACGECARAACVPPSELDARCVDGACTLVPRAAPRTPPLPARP